MFFGPDRAVSFQTDPPPQVIKERARKQIVAPHGLAVPWVKTGSIEMTQEPVEAERESRGQEARGRSSNGFPNGSAQVRFRYSSPARAVWRFQPTALFAIC
jgi:hypothetical protein